jgi:hypothetical protein
MYFLGKVQAYRALVGTGKNASGPVNQAGADNA